MASVRQVLSLVPPDRGTCAGCAGFGLEWAVLGLFRQKSDDWKSRKYNETAWFQVFYGEFDGRRRKRVLVKVIGE